MLRKRFLGETVLKYYKDVKDSNAKGVLEIKGARIVPDVPADMMGKSEHSAVSRACALSVSELVLYAAWTGAELALCNSSGPFVRSFLNRRCPVARPHARQRARRR